MNGKVTIAVPIYGVETKIERCVRSLFEQTYYEIEYLFVDDCTPDNSIIILKNVLEDYPSRKDHVHIVKHEQNRGLGAARNTAVEHCQTEFIIHVDSDDYVDTRLVEKVMRKQQECGADIVSFNYGEVQKSGKIVYKKYAAIESKDEWSFQILKRKYKCAVWSLLIRVSLYKDNKLRVLEGVDMGEDYQITPCLFYYAKTIVAIPDILYYYVKNDTSYTATFDRVKTEQTLIGVNRLKEFFKDKGDDFYSASLQGEAMVLAMYMMGCARAYDLEYALLLKEKMLGVRPEFINNIPLSYRFTYYLKDYFSVLHFIAIAGHALKKSINRL